MSDTLKCSTPIKPASVQEVKKDVTISQHKHDYWRNNAFQWIVFGWLIIGISAIGIIFLYHLFIDAKFQIFILNQIKNNIVFIVISVFAILKIQIPDINKWS